MGYGFVQYRKAEAAQKALRQLQVYPYPYRDSFIKTFCIFPSWFLANMCFFFFVSTLLSKHCNVDGHQLQLKISERATR